MVAEYHRSRFCDASFSRCKTQGCVGRDAMVAKGAFTCAIERHGDDDVPAVASPSVNDEPDEVGDS